MKRSEQTGANAPRKGTLQRQSQSGVAAYDIPALTRYPPPDFLTRTQTNLWIAVLGDMPLEFFRARHIPMMIQYVRAVERMMVISDEAESDPEDPDLLSRWERLFRLVSRMERHMGLDVPSLVSLITRARSEIRVAHQKKATIEAGQEERSHRAGLTYVGH
jgi:hypothetical protein